MTATYRRKDFTFCCDRCCIFPQQDGVLHQITDHHASISALLESAESCPLCKAFTTWLGDKNVEEAREAADRGETTQCRITVRRIFGDRTPLPRTVSWRILEIYSAAKVWETPTFRMCTSEGRMAHRAVWTCPQKVTFLSRVPDILDLLAKCDSAHPECQACFLPTAAGPSRLIDVNRLRLQNTSDLKLTGTEARYVALTHCWGDSLPLKTKRHNLAKFQRAISYVDIPRIYREAIAATRGLGVRFLWIDSLCIVQDDPADWDREASKMASIFQHAYLTISAISSKDGHGNLGVFRDHPPAMQFDLLPSKSTHSGGPASCDTGVASRVFINTQRPREAKAVFAKSPQKRRGWIFQERILSRRILYLAKDQFIWQCRRHVESEDGSYYRDNFEENNGHKYENEMRIAEVLKLQDTNRARNIWWGWMRECWRLRFTYNTDSWPAVLGITKLYQEVTGDTPVVGLWKRGLPGDLAWCMPTESSRPIRRLPTMPTWSWASIPHPSRDEISIAYIPELCGGIPYYTCTVFWKAQVTDINLDWMSQRLISPLFTARITLKGTVEQKDWKLATEYWDSTLGSMRGHLTVHFDVKSYGAIPPTNAEVILLYAQWSDAPSYIGKRMEVSFCYLIISVLRRQMDPVLYRRSGLIFFTTHMDELPRDLEGESPTSVQLI